MNIFHKDGNIFIETQGRTVRLHSSRPEIEATRLLHALPEKADALFLGGIGLGHALEKALEYPQLNYIFAIEPSPEIAILAEEIRPSLSIFKQDPRIIWIDSPEGLTDKLQDYRFSELALIISRSYGELFSKEFTAYQKIFAESLSRKELSKNTLVRFGRTWIKNLFRNLPRYLSSHRANSFLEWGKNKPAIVIGAGPSLAEALPYIKNIHHCAVLIAADTALPMLEQAAIEPDFVISVDPQELNAYHLHYTNNHNHFLVADPGVHASCFEPYSSDRIVLTDAAFPFYENFLRFWSPFGSLASGGSVSTSAFDFARKIGCSSIILAGQDLAFTQQKSYNSGNILWDFGRIKYDRLNPYHSIQARATYPSHALKLKGRKGDTVLADARFAAFAAWFSQEIPKTAATVYTAGMDGAFLEGAHHCPISEAFSHIKEAINKDFSATPPPVNDQGFKEYLSQLKKEAQNLYLIAKKTADYARRNDFPAFNRETQKLQKHLCELPDCARIIEIGIQNHIWKTLEMDNTASLATQQKQGADLIYEIEEILDFFVRIITKTLFLLDNTI